MYERGTIKYLKRYKQLISYEGLIRHRNITPTDIDGIIDYNGNAYIIMECKLIDKEIDMGQRIAFENIINALQESGRPSCLLLFRHNKKPEEIIIAKDCEVSDVYFQGKWKHYKGNNLLFWINRFEEYLKEHNVFI